MVFHFCFHSFSPSRIFLGLPHGPLLQPAPRPCRPRRTWQHSASGPRCRWRIWEDPLGGKTWENPWEIWENMEKPWKNYRKSHDFLPKVLMFLPKKTWSSWMLDGTCEIVLSLPRWGIGKTPIILIILMILIREIYIKYHTVHKPAWKTLLQTKSNDRMISPGITLLKPMRLLD